MKIYGSTTEWTRDCRPRWLLEELGLPFEYERVEIFKGGGKAPEYLALHPLGKVPVVIDGDVKVWESGATLLYLAETHGEGKMVPASGTPERALYYQWMLFGAATLEPTVVKIFVNRRFRAGQDGAEEAALAAIEDLKKLGTALGPGLEKGPFLLGEQFTAADIMIGTCLNWANMAEGLAEVPLMAQYLARLSERPAFQKTFAK